MVTTADIPASSTILVISDLTSLDRFKRLTSLGRSAYSGISVAVPSLDQRERQEKIVNRHYRGCGCAEGSIAVVVALVVGFAWNIRPSQAAPWTASRIAGTVALLFAAALAGKAFGLVRSRVVLRRAVARIERAVRLQGELEGSR